MIQITPNNFLVHTVQKGPHSPSAPRDSCYAYFKVCLAMEGSAVWEIEDRAYEITPGDTIFLNCGQRRHFTSFGSQGFKLCAFSLNRDAFTDLHHFAFFLERTQNHRNILKAPPLSQILLEIYEEMRGTHPLRYELASAKFTEFFIKAEKALGYAFQTGTKIDRQMLDILDYIDANVTSSIRLSELAAQAGLTESSFSRRFSKLNGISFKQYVITRRISRAIELLQTTDMKMADIALACGFDSISGFYDAFKKRTGTTPNGYSCFDV